VKNERKRLQKKIKEKEKRTNYNKLVYYIGLHRVKKEKIKRENKLPRERCKSESRASSINPSIRS
jgi:hypothetical protein